MPVMEYAHVVADIFQLTQVVGGDQDRHPGLRHIGKQDAPDLAAHHRVEAVHRLVED